MSTLSGGRLRTTVATGVLAGIAAVLLAIASAPAVASVGSPQWTVTSVSRPTNFPRGDEKGDNEYVVTVTNSGDAPSDGSPVTIIDELPQGFSLDPTGAFGEDGLAIAKQEPPRANFHCEFGACTYTGVVVPDNTLTVTFPVDVSPTTLASVTNVVRVAGGGAPDTETQTPTAIGEQPATFGFAQGGTATALSSTQAGAHPDLTVKAAFNTVNLQGVMAGDYKNVTYELPPGFALDLADTPVCSLPDFGESRCPIATQVGVATVNVITKAAGSGPQLEPVYNLAPNPGQVAKIGFLGHQGSISLLSDYGSRTIFENTPQGVAEVTNISLTFWGVPADPIHDPMRFKPHEEGEPVGGHFGNPSDAAATGFFTSPTLCSGVPLQARFEVTSWELSNSPAEAAMSFGPYVGCDRLTMKPSLTAEATTTKADAPSGLDVTMSNRQTYGDPHGLVSSTLKRAVVTLPEGMTVNPSAGAGLEGCSEAQFEQEAAQLVAGSGCPNESKLGSVKIASPALKEELTGSVFLAEPYGNPFGSLLALYVVARIPDRGVIIKAAGEVTADPVTGRLVTTFDTSNAQEPHGGLSPEPFGTFTLRFNQGATSPLVTPPTCGSYTVQAELTPWATPAEALPLLYAQPFAISEGFDGGPCPTGGVPPFKPQVISGTQNNDAGAYSPFYLRIIREDGEQEMTRFSTTLPPGLTGNLTGIPFCSEAQIEASKHVSGTQETNEPSCPAASEIGHTIVGAGVGPVLAQTPGKVYLAGPYHGSALSIVSVTSATVGPFDLGTVVIRFALRINPITAQVEVDATGSDPIPHIIQGIVVHVRDIRVYMNRNKFILDPTNCNPMSISNTITGAGADFTNPADAFPVTVTSPFQATNCAVLGFKPLFKVSTAGKTSRANGASLSVKLSYPNAAQGIQANIRSVKVDLPKQLPSRLTTLQKACTAAQFNANPAGCPAASVVGHAKAITPLIPVPLEGPAYFVSHGGEAFPSLIVVLQGYGITIDLVGSTFISKQGITSSTFKTVPDQPVGSFELTLPQGKFSALAANGNLCTSTLAMPTAFTAQNGATIHRSTPIGVTGCAKAKKKAKKAKPKKKK